ncbi:MAG: DUF5668 domain-containing protein [Chloroflexota bacterium]|nr:DUF5668 domain-containing protein [Chloroflexota bacterium]
MRRNNYFWAVFLILGGSLLLLSNLGIITINVWGLLWPLFLILIGAWFLLGSFLGYPSAEVEEAAIPLEGATQAKIRVSHGAGRLHLDDSAGVGELASGTFGGGLRHRAKQDGNSLDVKMSPARHGEGFLAWMPNHALNWDFGLSKEIPLELVFETGAGEAHLDLTNLLVTDFSLQTGASSNTVLMPANAGYTRAKIDAGAAAVTVHIPPGVAARIHTDSGLAAINIDQNRFPRQGKVYQSPDYETAINKIELDIDTGVSSVSVS